MFYAATCAWDWLLPSDKKLTHLTLSFKRHWGFLIFHIVCI